MPMPNGKYISHEMNVATISLNTSAIYSGESSLFPRESHHNGPRSQYSFGDSANLGTKAADGLASDQITSAIPEIYCLQFSRQSTLVASIQSLVPETCE
jgi:hypothetical protein